MFSNKNIELALIFIIPIIAAILVLVATRIHIGVSPDSTFYISAAQSIVENGEIRSIYEGSKWAYLSHYPPGYPIILSGLNYFTNDLYEAARFCNALSILVLLFSVGLIVRFHVQVKYALLLQLILLANFEIFKLYEMAWTEPSYLVFSLIGLYTLYLFVRTKKLVWLLISGTIIAIAVSVRYVGVTLIFSSAIYLWFALSNETHLRRIKLISIHGLISASSIVLWTVRNYILINNPTDRQFSFHPMPFDYYLDGLKYTAIYFIPIGIGEVSRWIIGALVVLLIMAYAVVVFKENIRSVKSLFLVYPIIYIAFLILSNTFLDDTPLYYRTLTPIYIFVIISFTIHLFEKGQRLVKLKTIVFSVFILFYAVRFYKHLIPIDDGKGYSSRTYMIPATIYGINLIPDSSQIYTNEVDRLYFLSDGVVADWWKAQLLPEREEYYIVFFKKGRNSDQMLLDFNAGTEDSLLNPDEVLLNTDDVLIKLCLPNKTKAQ